MHQVLGKMVVLRQEARLLGSYGNWLLPPDDVQPMRDADPAYHSLTITLIGGESAVGVPPTAADHASLARAPCPACSRR